MSVYNWNFKIIISKCLEPEYNFLHHCFSHFDNEIHDKMSCITKLKKTDFFFLERNTENQRGKRWKLLLFFFFFLFLEGIYFHHSVIFKKNPRNNKNMFFTKPSAKQTTHPLKYRLSLDWYSVEKVFDLYYHYGVKTVTIALLY